MSIYLYYAEQNQDLQGLLQKQTYQIL